MARNVRASWLVVAVVLALAVAAPVAVLASAGGGGGGARPGVVEPAAPRPGESCADETPEPGSSDVCEDVTGPEVPGGSVLDLGFLLPIVGALVAGAAMALVAAYLVLRRRPVAPLEPADPGEWWACANCGKTNVIGSARCYACGTWHR